MRYVTKEIEKSFSNDLINEIWCFYDKGYINSLKDSYQFIVIEKNKIVMFQEEPYATKIGEINNKQGIIGEVWIIDDNISVTMLFPYEY